MTFRAFLVLVAVSGCNQSASTPPEPSATASSSAAPASSARAGTRLAISKDGTRLGTLDLGARNTGMLMLKTEGADAEALAKLWDEIRASDTVRVNYAEGVRLKLLSEGYEVEDLP